MNECLNNTELNKLDGITKKYVDCKINNLTPPNYNDILDILNYISNTQEECCKETINYLNSIQNNSIKYLSGIIIQLNNHSVILEQLLKCCKTKPKSDIIPGQAIVEIYTNEPYEFIPTPPTYNQPILIEPIRKDINQSNMVLYPVDKGYFPILGIPGSWSVINRRIVDKAGTDLKEYLPIYFNHIVIEKSTIIKDWNRNGFSNEYDDITELVAIRGYSIKDTSNGKDQPLLIYEIDKDGVVKTFEGSTSLWNKYAS
jgi:hypothetical protein